MKEKKRSEQQKPASGGGDGDSIFDATPEPENKNVTVSSGPYLETLPVAGMSVAQVRRKFKDRFDIDQESTAIINGDDADEETILKAGEALMFVRHAGEKGGPETVTIEGATATATSPEGETKRMRLESLVGRMTPGMDTGVLALPTGTKAVLSRGHTTIMVWERPPGVQKLSWIAPNSPQPYGPGTKYRNVHIALPYLVIFAPFRKYDDGHYYLLKQDECFFATKPITKLSDELCFPGLLNCSKFGDSTNEGQPLSWICTQYLKSTPQMSSTDPGERMCAGLEAVRYCLLETSFNLSSEHHEGNSWYNATKTVDKRIATVEAWEAATKEDPLFVLDVPWKKTNRSVKAIADRMFKRLGASDLSVKSSSDLVRIINNG